MSIPHTWTRRMSDIDLQHPHTLSPEAARDAIGQLANVLDTRFGLNCRWQGERLIIQRPGVDGAITSGPGQLRVSARLGFPFSALRGQIESEIRRVLRERF